MHFTGTIWRPPFEADSALLQITSGCTHNKCAFCSLYDVPFRMSPIEEIESDLKELQLSDFFAVRVFMTGANPIVLSFDKLKILLLKIKRYLPHVKTIGGFARITDIKSKSLEQLQELHQLGLDGISIGTETGYDEVLYTMRKGHTVQDTIEQCQKLEQAEISYNIVYMNGLAGHGKGRINAIKSAEVYNRLKPNSINIVALTLFPESDLYKEMVKGTYQVTGEVEKIHELSTFIEHLTTPTIIYANTISNLIPFTGKLPEDKERVLSILHTAIERSDTELLEYYRKNISHL